MHIFHRKKEKDDEDKELLLIPREQKHRYDAAAVLLKTVLVFLIGYGAPAGFLSAYDIRYQNGLCMAEIFLFALVLCALHEIGRKWISNLTDILSFAGFLLLSMNNRLVVNSGYYVIVNKVLEEARTYLGVVRGTEYGVIVQDEYSAVTAFMLFIGMAAVMLLAMHVQHKIRLLRLILLTLPLYLIPLYFQKTPDLTDTLFLLTGYAAAGLMQGGNPCGNVSARLKSALPLAALLTAVPVTAFAFLMPASAYNRLVGENQQKKESEKDAANLVQFGFAALFQSTAGAGISGGVLSRGAALIPDYETDLIVRFTPYDYSPVYLKAFTGKDYRGDYWSDAGADGSLWEYAALREWLWKSNDALQGRGIMEVENTGADTRYEYVPYYADEGQSVRKNDTQTFVYYPRTGTDPGMSDEPDTDYLTVPDRCRKAVQRVCEKAGFWGTPEQIAEQVADYFNENYRYTLRPGFYYGSSDYITHFLLESKKGYCMHFASAAVMLFRYMGIPARYAEGYVFTYTDLVLDGRLREDAAYGDYYSGCSPIGETALIELEIPDASAHAWVEIYVDGKGWVVADPTPASGEDEEGASFWEDFLSGDDAGGLRAFRESNLGVYVQNVVLGLVYALFAGMSAVLILAVGRGVWRMRRERKLPERERVKREYGRIVGIAGRRSEKFAGLRTIREQTRELRRQYGMPLFEERLQELYEIFFAEHVTADCRQMRRELAKMRRRMKLPRFGRRTDR